MAAPTALAVGLASPAIAQRPAREGQGRDRYVAPYIELGQVVAADLANGDEVLTYTQVAAGIDAGVSTRRTQAQVSYRYEHRFQWGDDLADTDVHSGLARGTYRLTRALTLDAGALATRTRVDVRGAAPGVLAGNVANVTQLYSFYGGPSLVTSTGPVQLGAGYVAAFTKAEAPGATGIGAGAPRLDYFDTSFSQLATATAAVAPGAVLPVGITLSGAYESEEAGQLDQTYRGYYGRGDVLLPVSRTVALRAGVGYERIVAKERGVLRDALGNPVTDGDGRFVTDTASPVRIAYNTDGLIYDAGVIWRPSPRLELAANAGWRYGGETFTGSLQYRLTRDMTVQAIVYDGIETFGRQLRDGLRQLPTSFTTQADPFGQQFSGCVFGNRPGGGSVAGAEQGSGGGAGGSAGGCLNNAFQSISTAVYRARGIDAILSATRGVDSFGVGLGYANRRLYAPRSTTGVDLLGGNDESAYAQAFWSRALSRRSRFDANLYATWYDSGLDNGNGLSGGVVGAGATGSYSLGFGRLGTIASLGIYTFDQEGGDAVWSAQALLGARYTF